MTKLQAMRDGVATVLPTGSSLQVEGTTETQADLLKVLYDFTERAPCTPPERRPRLRQCRL